MSPLLELIRIRLPYERPPLSLNRDPHWAARNRIKKQLHDDVGWLVKGMSPILVPVVIELYWAVWDNRARDVDNPTPTLKAVVDGLVLARILPQDHSRIVVRSYCRIAKDRPMGLFLTVFRAPPNEGVT